MTGQDPLPGIESYSSALGAIRVLRRHGGIENLPVEAGFREVRGPCAKRGDIVSIPAGRGTALGICLGRDSAFAGKEGLVFLRTSAGLHFWGV